MNTEISQNKCNNLTREEQSALYNLKNDKNIAIKSVDKGSAVIQVVPRLRKNLEINIFMRRCVMIPELLKASYTRQLKKFGKETT